MVRSNSFYSVVLVAFRVLYIIVSLQCIVDFGSNVLIFWGIWLLSELFINGGKIFRVIRYRHYGFLFFFLLYFIIALMASGSKSVINNIAAFLEVVSPLLMYDLCVKENGKNRIIIIFSYTLVCVINCIYSYYFINAFGLTNLRKASDVESLHEQFYILRNSFKFIAGLSLIVPLYFHLYLHINWFKRTGTKILLLSLIFLFAYTVIVAQFVTAILFMIVGTFMALGYYNRKSMVIASVIVITVMTMLPVIITALNDSKSDNTVIVIRLEEINATIWGQGPGDSSDLDSRNKFSLNSFNTFVNNPLFGVTIIKGTNLKYEDVGNHASWIDFLARYGIFAFLIYVMLYFHIKKQLKENRLTLIPLLFLLLGFFNPLWFFHVISVAFLYSPLLLTMECTPKNN